MSFSVEAENIRRPVESAEHEGDAAVLFYVGGGFVSAADDVHVCDAGFGEHAEAVEAFGGEVDVAFFSQWSGGHEEHFLVADEVGVVGGDGGEEFSHGCGGFGYYFIGIPFSLQ